MGDYTKLEVWRDSIDLAAQIYKITSQGKLSKDYSLSDQIRRSSVSIASNIAEGESSGYEKMKLRFLYNAKGSIAELQSQLIIANEMGYLEDLHFIEVEIMIDNLAPRIQKLINFTKSQI